MLITNSIKVITAVYDSVLDFSIEYIESYNLFCCRIRYDKIHGSVAFVRPSVGHYIINRLQVIDTKRNNWRTTLILYCFEALFFDLRLVCIVSDSFIWLYCFHTLYAKIELYNTIDKLLYYACYICFICL